MKLAKQLLLAITFAAEKHKFQRRKGYLKIPYINHCIKVSEMLTECEESDIDVLIAGVLHDVIEDTETTDKEISQKFGKRVASVVKEVTDNMSLSQKERKQLQITKAPNLSDEAKKIKIADKICNIRDILQYPLDWSDERKLDYIKWSNEVVQGCKGINIKLDKVFDKLYKEGLKKYDTSK